MNREVERMAQPGRVLVFFRHLYYLRVPFENGDPQNSCEADPSRLQSNSAWKEFFARREIQPEELDDETMDEFMSAMDQLSNILYRIEKKRQKRERPTAALKI